MRKRPALTPGTAAVGQRGAAVAGPRPASQVETRHARPADPPGAVAAPHRARSLARDAALSLEGAGRGEPDPGDLAAGYCRGFKSRHLKDVWFEFLVREKKKKRTRLLPRTGLATLSFSSFSAQDEV